MKRFLIYITLVAMAFVYAPRTSAQSVLFDNGPLTADTDRCDSGPGVCLGSGNWTVFDDFNLNSTSNVTQIDFVSLLSFGDISDYIETNWSIWDSDPLTAAAPIFSGTTVGNAVDLGGGAYQFELSVNFTLTTGNYWFGNNNQVANLAATTAYGAVGNGVGALQTDNATFDFTDLPERAFTIRGDAVPEPSAGFILACCLGSLTIRRRL